MYFKSISNYRYHKITCSIYYGRYGTNVEIFINTELISTGKIKTVTNYGKLYCYYSKTYEIESLKKYDVLKKVRLYFHKKGYNSQSKS